MIWTIFIYLYTYFLLLKQWRQNTFKHALKKNAFIFCHLKDNDNKSITPLSSPSSTRNVVSQFHCCCFSTTWICPIPGFFFSTITSFRSTLTTVRQEATILKVSTLYVVWHFLGYFRIFYKKTTVNLNR